MPRNVRNFWLAIDIDNGPSYGSGPANKDGGFDGTIKMRHNGEVVTVAHLMGRHVVATGQNVLTVRPEPGFEMDLTPEWELRIKTTR